MNVARLAVLVSMVGVIVGCAAEAPIELKGGPPAYEVEVPSYATLAETHNLRVERLHTLYSPGVIEFEWTDDDGVHREQGDLDLWIVLPWETALRVSKLGDDLYWLGSDPSRYWMFEISKEETVAFVSEHTRVDTGRATDEFGVAPLGMLDLMALAPLPPADAEILPEVTYDRPADAFVVDCAGSGGTMRLYLDRQSHLPKRVELLGEAGEIVAHSELRRHVRVELPDAPPGAYPQMASRMKIVRTDGRGFCELYLDGPRGRIRKKQRDRVFNLDDLFKRFEPDRVETDESGGDAESVSSVE